ncbi:cytochrome P450 family 89 subfamily A polypeptide 5 [Euphorbia peplus]|nr:cytochrome P450 family 89 subfamily A polypeptide 5 [Euphorbia peplus]
MLLDRFESQSNSGDPVSVMDNFEYAIMFGLLVHWCFWDNIDERKIQQIKKVEHSVLFLSRRFELLKNFPTLTKILCRKSWTEVLQIFKERADVVIPLVRARNKLNENNKEFVLSYVDTLLNLQLPHEQRKLTENEIVSLCSEFLHASTDTIPPALEWIMANLVKYPGIQEKLFMEIKQVVKEG